jgi:hypothetical protein
MQYEKSDWWKLYYVLAELLEKGCRDLIAKSSGHPTNLTFEEWHAILEKIRRVGELTMEDKHPYTGKSGTKDLEYTAGEEAEIKEGLQLLTEYWMRLWD